ncbi:Hpt domain-containing protein [Nocardioides sp. Leaf374]|uniref:Hpt domain-containing protein n=1 Tax=Nocardioides sp. Leaf374 TaxID=2876560 RepID=UPI001E397D00|nr:Hpt domain-containing protein [Nocardioides sp. Leaf374]
MHPPCPSSDADVEPLLAAGDLVEAVGAPLAREVLGDLVAGLGARVAAVHDAASAGQEEELRRACHALRSAAAQVGARRLAATTTALERSGAGAALQRLDEVAASTARAIGSWLARSSSDAPTRG